MPSLKAMAREAQKLPKGAALKQPAKRTTGIFKSTERVDESDLESETESESSSESDIEFVKAVLPVKKLNGQKLKPESSSGGDDNGEQREVEHGMTRAEASEGSSASESESESGSGSGSESESDSQEDHGGSSSSGESAINQERKPFQGDSIVVGDGQSQTSKELGPKSLPPQHVPIYNPPGGFEIVSGNDNGKQKVVDIFNVSNLLGKQLWYITAPALVPIGSVKQVSLENVQLGKPALSLNGHEYGFVQEADESRGRANVLLPDEKRAAYRLGGKLIDQTLHLQRIVHLPTSRAVGSEKTFSASVGTALPVKKPIRKQPKGLKMRFRPIGFGNGNPGIIGSSSSSCFSADSMDSDIDEVTEDSQAPTRHRGGIDEDHRRSQKANVRLPSSENDSSSSDGDDGVYDSTVHSKPRALTHKKVNSDNNPKMSEHGRYAARPRITIPKDSPELPSRPLKRKRGELNGTKASKSPEKSSNINSSTVNTPITKRSLPPPGELKHSKVNGIPKIDGSAKISSDLSSPKTKITPIPPPRASGGSPSSPAVQSIRKTTPILPPRSSQILPPVRLTSSSSESALRSKQSPSFSNKSIAMPDSSHVSERPVVLITRPDKSPDKDKKPNKRLKIDKSNDIEGAAGVAHLGSSTKHRKPEKRALEKKEARRLEKQNGIDILAHRAIETIGRRVDKHSPPREAHQPDSVVKSPRKPSLKKSDTQNGVSNTTPNQKKVEFSGVESGKDSENQTGVSTSSRSNEKATKAAPGSSIVPPPPRKESVILPPKFKGSVSR